MDGMGRRRRTVAQVGTHAPNTVGGIFPATADEASASELRFERDNARRALIRARLQVNIMRPVLEMLTQTGFDTRARTRVYKIEAERCRTAAERVLAICNKVEDRQSVDLETAVMETTMAEVQMLTTMRQGG